MEHFTKNPVELKIKAKSLASEAVIIRQEEQKSLKKAKKNRDSVYRLGNTEKDSEDAARRAKASMFVYERLNEHRRGVLRLEARATHIARAFLAEKKFSDIEVEPIWPKLQNAFVKNQAIEKARSIVSRYYSGPNEIGDVLDMFDSWVNEV